MRKRKPTIYEALRTKFGREPTPAEIKADVQRILADATIDRRTKHRPPCNNPTP